MTVILFYDLMILFLFLDRSGAPYVTMVDVSRLEEKREKLKYEFTKECGTRSQDKKPLKLIVIGVPGKNILCILQDRKREK